MARRCGESDHIIIAARYSQGSSYNFEKIKLRNCEIVKIAKNCDIAQPEMNRVSYGGHIFINPQFKLIHGGYLELKCINLEQISFVYTRHPHTIYDACSNSVRTTAVAVGSISHRLLILTICLALWTHNKHNKLKIGHNPTALVGLGLRIKDRRSVYAMQWRENEEWVRRRRRPSLALSYRLLEPVYYNYSII